jgi:hypothetical protein
MSGTAEKNFARSLGPGFVERPELEEDAWASTSGCAACGPT